jgi:hypothetical protein
MNQSRCSGSWLCHEPERSEWFMVTSVGIEPTSAP